MIMWFLVYSLIVTVPLAKAMLLHETHLSEQGEGAVYCCQADIGCVALRSVVDTFCVEMLIALFQYVQDQATLRGQASACLSKCLAQCLP
jgi:hypothetical protein